MDDSIRTLSEWIKGCDNIVFFGGAGVSTESGIPDFRSVDGLYNQKFDYPPEVMLSHTFFMDHTEEFYKFYKEKLVARGAKPNKAHLALKKLEDEGKLKAVITQNVDGLHSIAGCKNVIELHGSQYRNYCMRCGRAYGLDYVDGSPGVPRCACGGIVKPDVVLYEEGLNNSDLSRAIRYISECGMLIIGGTSLNVYPAAGLINYYRGHKLVLLNRGVTPYDGRADLVIREPIGKVLGEVCGIEDA